MQWKKDQQPALLLGGRLPSRGIEQDGSKARIGTATEFRGRCHRQVHVLGSRLFAALRQVQLAEGHCR